MQTLIPRFYFPNGKPCPDENIEQCLKDAAKVFQDHPNGEVPQSAFHEVTKVRQYPKMLVTVQITCSPLLYWYYP